MTSTRGGGSSALKVVVNETHPLPPHATIYGGAKGSLPANAVEFIGTPAAASSLSLSLSLSLPSPSLPFGLINVNENL